MAKVLCIYHANCTDGFAAAWAVRHALGDGVELFPSGYGQAPPSLTGRDVVLVDFSYKRDQLAEISEAARSLLILDHHKTAEEDLRGIGVAPESWAEWAEIIDGGDPKLRCAAWFDMQRSGAGLAWDFFHDATRPWLIDLVEVRDLWRKDDLRWEKARLAHAYVNSFDMDFFEWDQHMRLGDDEEGQERIIHDAAAILRQHDRHVRKIAAVSRRKAQIAGCAATVVNCPPWMASDVGDLLNREPGMTFVAAYQDTEDYRLFSLRSRAPDGIDVSAIAKLYGGGGHKHAAGFRVPRHHPLAVA